MTSSIKYAWVEDLKTGTFLANSRELVRVMGVVIGIGDCSSSDAEAVQTPLVMGTKNKSDRTESESDDGSTHGAPANQLLRAQYTTTGTEEDFVSVTIDDGTNSIAVWVPRRIINPPPATNLEIGKSYDCILKLQQSREEKHWIAETLIPVEDLYDEHFRWLELSHHGKSSSQSPLSRSQYSNFCHKFGFPTRRRNGVEVYRLISLNHRVQHERQQQKMKQLQLKSGIVQKRRNSSSKLLTTRQPLRPHQQRPRGLLQNSSTVKKRIRVRNETTKRRVSLSPAPTTPAQPKPTPLEGLLLKDLAAVLQKSEQDVQEMIEGLQLEGKIYQNERGEYLPL